MTYVPEADHKPFVHGSRHDIFISYAHRDNETDSEKQRGWVTTFAGVLGRRLGIELGADFSLWMDAPELAGNKPLSGQIMEALGGTATFIVIASPSYLASEWCRKEREEFLRLVKQRTDSDSRVFLVEFNKVAREKFPAEFGELIPYVFWTGAGRDKRILGWPTLADSDQSYYDQITRLCTDLAEELKRLSALAEEAARQPQPQTTGEAQAASTPPLPAVAPRNATRKPTVFVAEVTSDLNLLREAVVDYLEQSGLRVLPETWQRYASLSEFDAAFARDIAQSEFFVQLLSDSVGERPFGLEQGLPRLQYERALAAGKAAMLWRDPNLNMSAEMDEDQRALLEGCHVCAVGLQDFKDAVVEAATPKSAEAQQPKAGGKLVYIGADPQDKDRVNALTESDDWAKTGVGGLMLDEEDDPGSFRQAWEETLRTCDGALLVYFQAEPSSVISKVKKYCRFLLSQPVPPFSSIAIYDGPPPPDQKVGINVIKYPKLNLRKLDCRKDHKELEDFLNQL